MWHDFTVKQQEYNVIRHDYNVTRNDNTVKQHNCAANFLALLNLLKGKV
jgi:hypothetical protein